jgi:hypothetical protein
MRKLAIILLLITNLTLTGQIPDSTIEIIDYLETAPTFPGGDKEIWCFFENNFRYDILNTTKIKARYFIRFIVDTTGYPSNIEFIATRPEIKDNYSDDSLIKREILRVFHFMPKWNPAEIQGTKVPCRYVLPIEIPYNNFKCHRQNLRRNIEYNPDIPAEFIEGLGQTGYERMINYLNLHLQWPSQDDCEGKVFIKCIINKSGKPIHFEFVRRLCPDFDNEAMRVVMGMPKWKPATKNNKKVRSTVVIPITFKILN